MDNIFYLTGVLYFVFSVYNFFAYNDKKYVSIDSDTEFSKISDMYEELEKNKRKNIIKRYLIRIANVLFFVWTYIGCIGNFPEKQLFLFNLSVLILYITVLIFMGVILAVNMFKKIDYDRYPPDEIKEKKIKILPTKIVYFLEMIIVGTIVIIHYFIR
jgi:hypothetical protein